MEWEIRDSAILKDFFYRYLTGKCCLPMRIGNVQRKISEETGVACAADNAACASMVIMWF